MVSKWIRFEKSSWNFAANVVIFDKIVLYAGRMDHWAIGVELSFYDRSLTFKILNLYAGIEIYHKPLTD